MKKYFFTLIILFLPFAHGASLQWGSTGYPCSHKTPSNCEVSPETACSKSLKGGFTKIGGVGYGNSRLCMCKTNTKACAFAIPGCKDSRFSLSPDKKSCLLIKK